jgi:hypothetical protein
MFLKDLWTKLWMNLEMKLIVEKKLVLLYELLYLERNKSVLI